METRQRYLLRIFSLFCVHACQIIDFGLAIGIPVDANGMTCSLPPAGAVGKIFYMPPEVRKVGIPSSLFLKMIDIPKSNSIQWIFSGCVVYRSYVIYYGHGGTTVRASR